MVNVADFFRPLQTLPSSPAKAGDAVLRDVQNLGWRRLADTRFHGYDDVCLSRFQAEEPLLVRGENPVAPGLQSHDIAGLKLVIPRRVDLNQRLALART